MVGCRIGLRAVTLAGTGTFVLAAGAVAAEPIGSVLDTVVVTGTAQRSTKLEVSSSPESLPASVTVISAEEIERRPISHYADLFRPVVGRYHHRTDWHRPDQPH